MHLPHSYISYATWVCVYQYIALREYFIGNTPSITTLSRYLDTFQIQALTKKQIKRMKKNQKDHIANAKQHRIKPKLTLKLVW